MKFIRLFFKISLILNFLFINLIDCQLDKPYDYYLFQLTWPSTFCRFNRCQNEQNIEHFVIHGNWPSRFDKNYVNYCSDDDEDFSVLDPIKNKLIKLWPSLKGDHSSFWEYEFKKHATCVSMETPSLKGFFYYFFFIIQLKTNFLK